MENITVTVASARISADEVKDADLASMEADLASIEANLAIGIRIIDPETTAFSYSYHTHTRTRTQIPQLKILNTSHTYASCNSLVNVAHGHTLHAYPPYTFCR